MPIYKVKGGWRIANTRGKSPTRKAAQRRLAAIKASQARKKKTTKRRTH